MPFFIIRKQNGRLVKNDVEVVVAYIIFLPVPLAGDDETISKVAYNTKVLKYAHRMFNCNVQNEQHEKQSLRVVTSTVISDPTGKKTVFYTFYFHVTEHRNKFLYNKTN